MVGGSLRVLLLPPPLKLFLMDVLTVLVDVSKQFQEKTATISRILVTIEVAVEQITKLQTRFDNTHPLRSVAYTMQT
jgi:hypothetical protein